jgi:molybdopterin-guanine dinucleotide biosynthesis protein A
MSVPAVSGLILAGGEGRRMGGADKGMQLLRGRPLIEWVIERLGPQVRELLISANGSAYGGYGYPVLADELSEKDGSRAGPLAGLHAGMNAATQPFVATAPCDAPFVPPDLVKRLHDALQGASSDVAVAKIGGRLQPVFVLARRESRATLEKYLRQSGRRADGWYASLKSVEVAFDDEAEAFANANTLDELRGMQ